jgi:hypothetical protein
MRRVERMIAGERDPVLPPEPKGEHLVDHHCRRSPFIWGDAGVEYGKVGSEQRLRNLGSCHTRTAGDRRTTCQYDPQEDERFVRARESVEFARVDLQDTAWPSGEHGPFRPCDEVPQVEQTAVPGGQPGATEALTSSPASGSG